MEQRSCGYCSERFEGKGGPTGRLPVVFPCLCRVCKVCALKQEAEAQQQPPAGGGGKEKKKGKGKKQSKVARKPTPCLFCGALCDTPVCDLFLDVALLKQLEGATALAAPLCDACDDAQATKHCGYCKKFKHFCDDCYSNVHSSAKMKGHTAVPIQEHLASTSAGSASAGAAASLVMCAVHPTKLLDFFCDDCNILVCATCGILHHNGHALQPIEEAAQAQRGEIETAIATTTVSHTETTEAVQSLKELKAEINSNRINTKQTIIAKFRKVSQASLNQSNALCKIVDDAHKEKTDAVDVQIDALETSGTRSEVALALAKSTLEVATSEHVLQITQMIVGGLSRLGNHGLATEQCRSSTISVIVTELFEQTIAQMPLLLKVNVGNTNAAASKAVGDGVAKAVAGGDGSAAKFDVIAIEFGTGKQRAAGGDAVTVRVVPKEKEGIGGSGGGGEGGAAAKSSKGGKRKRVGSGGGAAAAASATKKSKTGAATSSTSAVMHDVRGAVVDNGDGSYNCSYEMPAGAQEKDWVMEVLMNGGHVVGSPFAIEVAAITSLGGIEIAGATGENGAYVNGIFEKTEEMKNDKPVYIKVGSSGMACCFYAPDETWTVSATTEKDANENAGVAYSIEEGLAAPELATQWNVDVGEDEDWKQQAAVTVVVLSGAELHAANVAADAAAAVALAASGFTIAGATGNTARRVNGSFSKTDEMQNGKPVYSKDGDADIWCYCARGGKWIVTDTEDKDVNENSGFAATVEEGLAAPQLAAEWNVIVDDEWAIQPTVKATST